MTFNATPGDLTATGQAYALIGNALKGARRRRKSYSPRHHASSPAPVQNPIPR
jgi:hypothetical protein